MGILYAVSNLCELDEEETFTDSLHLLYYGQREEAQFIRFLFLRRKSGPAPEKRNTSKHVASSKCSLIVRFYLQ